MISCKWLLEICEIKIGTSYSFFILVISRLNISSCPLRVLYNLEIIEMSKIISRFDILVYAFSRYSVTIQKKKTHHKIHSHRQELLLLLNFYNIHKKFLVDLHESILSFVVSALFKRF